MRFRSITLLSMISLALLVAPVSAQSPAPEQVGVDTAARMVGTLPGSDLVLVADRGGLVQYDGESWIQSGPVPPLGRIVATDTDPPLMLAGDQPSCMLGGNVGPLMRSDDGGATWSEVDGVADVRPMAIWPEYGLALGASCPGIQYSLDLGVTWDMLPNVEPGWDVTAFTVVEGASGPGPVILVSLTGEGGTSYLVRIDLSDPTAPIVSDHLRMYYALGGLAARGDTYVLAAMDGVWTSNDAGLNWERSVDGLEDVTVADDPAIHGLPIDFEPNSAGLFAVAFMPGDGTGLVVGSVNGLYQRWDAESPWSHLEGTIGEVRELALTPDGDSAVYRAAELGVFLMVIRS